MKELYEFRIGEDYAPLLFAPSEHKRLGSVRKALIPGDDPKLGEIGRLQTKLNKELGKSLYFGWDIYRSYSSAELEASRWFKLRIRKVFEPAGEECGTIYDETSACPVCGSGARQATPLFLPQSSIPKTKDLSETIAGEMVVSQRLVDAFRRHNLTGAEFEPIRSKRSPGASPPEWYQLLVPSAGIRVSPPTRTGIKPFDEDREGTQRCERGDLIGLNLLSEVSFKKQSAADLDVQASADFIGLRSGLLRPKRIIFVSQRVRKVLEEECLKGAELEVAHDV